MKLVDLLNQLETIKAQYGNDLDIALIIYGPDGKELWGELDRIEVEERTTLNLICLEGEE